MSDLTERYRPQTIEEYIGDKKVLKQVLDYAKNDVPVILVGDPGVGKTTMAYLVAKELGMRIEETNSSDKRKSEDLSEFERKFKTRSIVPTLFLFDEIDGMSKKGQRRLSETIKKAIKPVIITANDNMKVSLSLKKYCKLVELKLTSMHLQSVIDRIKEIAKKEDIKDVNYEKVCLDVRSSIRCVLEKSQGYKKEENNFEKTKELFIEKKIERNKSSNGNDVTIPWVLDNIYNFYYGLDIYKAVRILGISAELGDINLLSNLPNTDKGRPKYPYYLRKRSKYAQYND